MTDHPDTPIPESAGAGDVGSPAPLSGGAVCAEFDALSERLHGWSTLSSVNAAWHGFKCGVEFAKNQLVAQDDKAPERQPDREVPQPSEAQAAFHKGTASGFSVIPSGKD